MKMLHQICTVRVYIGETLVGSLVKSDLTRTTSDGINGEGCGILGGKGRTPLPTMDRYLSTREILTSSLERIVGGRETVPNKDLLLSVKNEEEDFPMSCSPSVTFFQLPS